MFKVKDVNNDIYSIDIFIIEDDNIHFTANNNLSYLSPLTFSEFNKSLSPINEVEYEKMIEDIDKHIKLNIFLTNIKKVVCISDDNIYHTIPLEINKIYDVIGYYIASKDEIFLHIKDYGYLPIILFQPLSEYRKEKIKSILLF